MTFEALIISVGQIVFAKLGIFDLAREIYYDIKEIEINKRENIFLAKTAYNYFTRNKYYVEYSKIRYIFTLIWIFNFLALFILSVRLEMS